MALTSDEALNLASGRPSDLSSPRGTAVLGVR